MIKKNIKSKKSNSKKKDYDFDKKKSYEIEEAIELCKKFSKTKFNSSIEVHFRLGIDAKKGDQQIRGAVSLPHGTGKTVKVAAFVEDDKVENVKKAGADFCGNEDLIAEIKKTEKTDFQVAIAEPNMMKKLASIAKILGTRGLMPSPKNETVTPDPAKAVSELKKGKINFKNDDTGNIHFIVGKIDFDNKKLIENFHAILEVVKKVKPKSSKGIYIKNISVCSTMGPGIKVVVY